MIYELQLDNSPNRKDIVLHEGCIALYIDPGSASLLRGSRIDYVDRPKESGFIIRGAGGCGPECTCEG